jgi:hypothetical protein
MLGAGSDGMVPVGDPTKKDMSLIAMNAGRTDGRAAARRPFAPSRFRVTSRRQAG